MTRHVTPIAEPRNRHLALVEARPRINPRHPSVRGVELLVDMLPERLASKINVDDATGCWLWNAATNGAGYGYVSWLGRNCQAHRLTYHLLVDPETPVYPGRGGGASVLDHVVCETPRCVNPLHLEPTSNRRNLSRIGGTSQYVGVSWSARKQRWKAGIKFPGQSDSPCFLGWHSFDVTAAHVYDAACFILVGDHPNFLSGLLDRLPNEAEHALARKYLDRSERLA